MISKEDTQALRQADTLVFHHLRSDRRNGHVGSIRALKHIKAGTGAFQIEDTAEYEIGVDSLVRNYGDKVDIDILHAAVVLNARWVTAIGTTLKSVIRAGDKVELEWLRNNTTTNHENAGLVSDELRMHILRGKRRFVYLVNSQVGLDNSARMIRTSSY